jgi:hypothetical protein
LVLVNSILKLISLDYAEYVGYEPDYPRTHPDHDHDDYQIHTMGWVIIEIILVILPV